jgi:hypothetical protein
MRRLTACSADRSIHVDSDQFCRENSPTCRIIRSACMCSGRQSTTYGVLLSINGNLQRVEFLCGDGRFVDRVDAVQLGALRWTVLAYDRGMIDGVLYRRRLT